MISKVINGLFVGLVLALLGAGLARTVLFPKEINAYENRYAEKIAPLTVEGWMDGSFQDSVDAALADQVQLAQMYKRVYNFTSSRYLKRVTAPLLPLCYGRYINYSGALLYNDFITYPPRVLADMTERLDAKADNYNQYFAAHPELEFYAFYIEKDTDINLETGEKVPACEYLFDRLELPRDRLGRYAVDSFDEFSAWFYRTDHHWNLDGSYRGYVQVLNLLGVEDAPLAPISGPVEIGRFSGSKATGAAGVFSEPFYAYRYDFPDMKIMVNGIPENYGAEEAFFAGAGGTPSYSGFYGGDAGEVIFSANHIEGENILILGESYDNAVLKLLATHFNNIYAVDLRYYEAYMGQKFLFSEYVEEHDITKVLLIGNIDYYLLDDFLLEG